MNTRYIGNAHDPQPLTPPAPPAPDETGAGKTPENTPGRDLSKLTDSASLSSFLPRLQGILEVIEQPENNVFQNLDGNISKLQDAFVDAVYEALSARSIDFSRKITLRLNDEQELAVAGEHPDKETVEQLLAGRPEFSAAFKEIASQSELLRNMRNIGKVIGARNGLEAYQTGLAGQNAGYQVSLKGEMSHFYFSR